MDDRELDLLRGQVGTVIEATDAEVVIVEFAARPTRLHRWLVKIYCDCTTTNQS